MPRQARIDAPGACLHIICRGIERRKIFLDDTDPDRFLLRLVTSIVDEIERFEMAGNDGVCKTISLTLSIGLTSCLKGMSAAELLERVDEAMYKAPNRKGRTGWSGTVWIDPEAPLFIPSQAAWVAKVVFPSCQGLV